MSGFSSFFFVGKHGVHIEIAQQTQTNQTIDTDMCIFAVRAMKLVSFKAQPQT